MGIILLGMMILYLFFAIIIFIICWKTIKSKIVVWIIGLILVLFPFKHSIFYGVLFNIYDMKPLQEIHRTVESPHSVYWEDNVWPGFDEYGRSWMVRNYLDGIHLQALALNGDDGKIYLYRAMEKSRVESILFRKKVEELEKREEELRLKSNAYYKKHGERDPRFLEQSKKEVEPLLLQARREEKRLTEEELERIFEKVEIYTSAADLPPLRYHVRLESIHRFFPVTKLYHADLITISDVQKNEVLGFSKRFMAYAPWISKISGEQPKFGAKKGSVGVNEFDDKVLFEYADLRTHNWMRNDLNKASYQLSAIDWESKQINRNR